MTRAEALAALGLTGSPSPDAVRAAFKALSRQLVTPEPGDVIEPFYSIDDLRAARDALINSSENDFPPCIVCRGRGKVRSGFGVQTCVACGGSGEKR